MLPLVLCVLFAVAPLGAVLYSANPKVERELLRRLGKCSLLLAAACFFIFAVLSKFVSSISVPGFFAVFFLVSFLTGTVFFVYSSDEARVFRTEGFLGVHRDIRWPFSRVPFTTLLFPTGFGFVAFMFIVYSIVLLAFTALPIALLWMARSVISSGDISLGDGVSLDEGYKGYVFASSVGMVVPLVGVLAIVVLTALMGSMLFPGLRGRIGEVLTVESCVRLCKTIGKWALLPMLILSAVALLLREVLIDDRSEIKVDDFQIVGFVATTLTTVFVVSSLLFSVLARIFHNYYALTFLVSIIFGSILCWICSTGAVSSWVISKMESDSIDFVSHSIDSGDYFTLSMLMGCAVLYISSLLWQGRKSVLVRTVVAADV